MPRTIPSRTIAYARSTACAMNVLSIASHQYGADCMQSYACFAKLCLPLANATMDCIRSAAMGTQVEMVEVGPRDGLQIDPLILPTPTKIELVTRLLAAGLRRIEVTSFVSPRKVPQMADAEQVLAGLSRPRGAHFIGLVMNRKGFDRAAVAGC